MSEFKYINEDLIKSIPSMDDARLELEIAYQLKRIADRLGR